MAKQYLSLIFIITITVAYAQFGEQQLITDQSLGAQSVFAADFDNDGKIDVVTASLFNDKISWYRNIDGLGNFNAENIIFSLDEPRYAYAADLDGDGDMDVISISYTEDLVVWFENLDGEGNFGAQQNISTTADGSFYALAADIDGDGDMDIVGTSDLDNVVAWYENLDGNGNFGNKQIITTTANNGRSIFAGDLDGDGDLDIVASSSGDVILSWFENLNGEGDFGEPHIIATTDLAKISVFAIDLDGDNDLDIVCASPGNDMISWYKNTDGLGTYGTEQIITSQADFAYAVFAADLDNDSDNDVLSASSIDNKIAWYENIDGLGNFSEQIIITTDAVSARSVFAADIDNDGDLDVLSASQNDNKIAWYENFTILGVKNNTLFTFKVYPNPATDKLHIQSSNTSLNSVSIMDINGRVIYLAVFDYNEINVSSLKAGMYFLKIESPQGSTTRKFVKK